jgi:uncharacterized protein YndB with AHSA1/START domain
VSDAGDITPCWTITFHRRSRHSAHRLWAAITDPDEVSAWMTYPARIDLRVGGDYHIDFSRTDEGALDGVIVRVEPERTVAFVWGRSVLEWVIEPDGAGCRYAIVHHGQKPPSERDGYTDEGLAAGWHSWIDALGAHLDGVASTAEALSAHETLQASYRERFAALFRDL